VFFIAFPAPTFPHASAGVNHASSEETKHRFLPRHLGRWIVFQ
jgi:hypothetical protein